MSRPSAEIQSLTRGLVALDFVAQGSVRPSELAAALDISRPSAYRLLQTLASSGYVYQSPETKAFRVNPAKIFTLAQSVRGSLTWLGVVEGMIAELARKTGETANMALLQGAEAVYVAAAESSEPLSVRHLVGTRRPLHCSAIGKAMLANVDGGQRTALLAKAGLPRLTSHTITSIEELEEQLHQVRLQGWAFDDQETIDGVRCIAAPVISIQSDLVGAIGVSAPAGRLGDDEIPRICELVKQTSQELSKLSWDV